MGNLAEQLAAKFGESAPENDKPEGTPARLARIIAQITGDDPQEIRPTTRLRDDLGGSSLDLVEITVKTEEAFGVELDGQTMMRCDTVGDLAAFLDTTSR
ncbi:acyl carrier protein [Corynebacterium sp. zg-331]|uniref:acyl carrier protein n=1 Tax=unclassified Corynebacterium TaxID=2624378 RepID=UPI001642D859|nr:MULTISPECIES: acyl carrier protein [unclassified Corynebacterium]MBC3185148.1 acyl carrier protein [Corynebacterium sp. zg-331]